jgi:hypothetical protein
MSLQPRWLCYRSPAFKKCPFYRSLCVDVFPLAFASVREIIFGLKPGDPQAIVTGGPRTGRDD